MSTNLATIEVDVPVEVAFDQWTALQKLPVLMTDVDAVTPLEDGRHRWVTKIAGFEREFESEVVEHAPPGRIAWTTVDGVQHEGEVTFDPVDEERTAITVRVDLEPGSTMERVADQLGVVRRRLQANLEDFKQSVEARPTGSHLNASYDPFG